METLTRDNLDMLDQLGDILEVIGNMQEVMEDFLCDGDTYKSASVCTGRI